MGEVSFMCTNTDEWLNTVHTLVYTVLLYTGCGEANFSYFTSCVVYSIMV